MQAEIKAGAQALADEAVDFFREIIRIPSLSGDEARVIAAIAARMEAVGFDEVRTDPFGNILGRIGSGKRVIAFDAHVDTVDVGDPALWKVDPFGAEMVDGIIYGRGASDQKGGMAALVYAGALLKKLAIEGNFTAWMVGSVLEEDCDGLCWHYILHERVLAPELVVLTEPTNLNLYRGQRGRMEIEVTTHGISCHGSAPERGINAIHRMAPLLAQIETLDASLPADDFLGQGSITTSQIRSQAPSLCAVADVCTIHLDRRMTAGETDESAIAEIRAILEPQDDFDPVTAARVAPTEIEIPEFNCPTHTGLVYPMRQYYPAWALPEDHEFVKLGLRARESVLGERAPAGKWTFSTNGVATMGMHGVPTIGFGPANEVHAHAPSDQCPATHIETAIGFYTALLALLA